MLPELLAITLSYIDGIELLNIIKNSIEDQNIIAKYRKIFNIDLYNSDVCDRD
jgi:hypothetical protein